MEIRVRRDDGWTIVTFPADIERVSVGLAPGEGGHTITLTGVREDGQNVLERHILDVDPDDEAKLNSEIPRQGGVALPIAERAQSQESDADSKG